MKGVVEKEAEKKGLQQQQQQRCQSWLQSKRRLCASPAMPGSQLRTTPPCNSIFKHPFFNVYPHSKSFLIVVTTLNLCCIFLIAVTTLN
jgi:hypothetical protein